ncbi:MAG: multicopper oxidase domain-containing protein [Chitinophagales bacterium]|nr:multicopper oxidase domain-containing protein [Chitinophagales bacterium]
MLRLLLLLVNTVVVATLLVAQNPLAIPDTLSGSSLNLALQTGTVNFKSGQATNTMGANGNLLGPTLILNRYQNVTINVTNQLSTPTTIHWHGLHVPARHDGGPHIVIPDGTTWSPSFQVLDWAGTYWYHPHLHMHTNEHVQKGIAGLIIVRDSLEAALTLPRTYGKDDFPLVVQTKAFDANNQIIVESALDSNLMVNGTMNPYLEVPAQVVRLRLLNGSSERYYNFGFTGNKTFYQIATDGGLLTAPVALTRLQLAPGERAEILVDLSTLNGQSLNLMSFGSQLPSAIYGAAQPGMGAGQTIPNYQQNPLNGNDFKVLQLNVTAPTANAVTAIPATLLSHNPWQANQANITRQLVFTPVNMGPTAIQGPFVINNAPFDMMTINYRIPLNNIEIWELRNQSPIGHPFHIHHVQFYVLDINGNPPPANMQGRKDVVHVPAGNSIVRFITRFETYADDSLPYMYHCHILTHEDGGMMGQYTIEPPCISAIATQPADVTTSPGSNTQFSVTVSDSTATFQWQTDMGTGFQNLTNAGQYSGVNTSTLSIANVSLANNNQYFRCVVTAAGCADTTILVRLSVVPVGIADAGKQTIRLYPNPVANKLTVDWEQTHKHEAIKLYITDITGRLVQTALLSSPKTEIELASLQAGLYFLKTDGNKEVFRIMKH